MSIGDGMQDEEGGHARIVNLQVLGNADVQSGLMLFQGPQPSTGASPQVRPCLPAPADTSLSEITNTSHAMQDLFPLTHKQ